MGLVARLGRVPGLRTARAEPRIALILGAVVGAAVGAAAAGKQAEGDGNTIAGEVAVHLLDRIELLTVKLEVRHAPKARGLASKRISGDFDVHRNRGT